MPGLRWMKYKEGFSSQLVADLLEQENPQSVLDPFAGICTTPLTAAGQGRKSTGLEIMPVGVLAGTAISEAANGLTVESFSKYSSEFLKTIKAKENAADFAFPHVGITTGAFSQKTEKEIARARKFLSTIDNKQQKAMLELACLSVLEESSYTRKDGQYLRWDRRAQRSLRSSVDLGDISSFVTALERRISEMKEDIEPLKKLFGGEHPNFITGSCLDHLKEIPDEEFEMVITSPPYANRYDYTRTYALELAWMGFGQGEFSKLRQQMLSATVENKSKRIQLKDSYGTNRAVFDRAAQIYDNQGAIHEVLTILRDKQHELSNKNILRLIEEYFFEMAVVVSELGRIIRPGGVVIMVNDNVQYHGEELPVDFILADFAEQCGFRCETIWKLARGKGNSSQQMAKFGRQEIRKCVYRWVRTNER